LMGSRWRCCRGPMIARSNGTCSSTCRRARRGTTFARLQKQQHLGGGSWMRRNGELSSAVIDRSWPHQVVLPARLCDRDGYNEIHEFGRDLTLCSRGHALYHDGQWFHVYCFKEAVDAQKFMGDSAAKSSILSSAAAVPIGRGGRRVSTRRSACGHRGATIQRSFDGRLRGPYS